MTEWFGGNAGLPLFQGGKPIEKEGEMTGKGTELSNAIRALRSAKGLSLRQVEKRTGISNAYLSQLENGKIEKPSPHILYTLADVYDTSYEDLMKLAGYLQKKQGERVRENVMEDVAFSAIRDLTEEERDEVLRFISFLRTQRKSK